MASAIPKHLKLDVSADAASAPMAKASSSSAKSSNDQERPKKKVNTKLYKTNLCRTFSRTGHCPYGLKCQFAHGENELRPVPADVDENSNTVSPPISGPAISSPVAVSILNAGSNHPQVSSPRVEALSLENAFTPKQKMSFAAAALASANSSLPSSKSSNSNLNTPMSGMASPSPRVAMLNLSGAAEVAEKPIPEGARVDCDPKVYKTELCRSFSKDGVCRYGAKCQFAHGIEELRPAPHGGAKIVKLRSPTALNLDQPEAEKITVVDVSIKELTEMDIKQGVDDMENDSAPQSPAGKRSTVSPSPRVKDVRVYKTELCQKFSEKGECPYGMKCQFAHGEKELRQRLPGTTPTATPSTKKQAAGTPITLEDEKASADADRRQDEVNTDKRTPDPKLYKTELCRSFNRTGYCRYGLKCQFAHGIQELRPSPRLVNAALKIGIDIASPAKAAPSISSPLSANVISVDSMSQSAFVSESDTKYTPMSPRNLSGSPVIGSPSNRMLKLNLGSALGASSGVVIPPAATVEASASEQSSANPAGVISPRVRILSNEPAILLPKASPTAARQAFSFSSPLNPAIIEAARSNSPVRASATVKSDQ